MVRPNGEQAVILIADDDALVQNTLSALLTEQGYRVVIAVDGKEAQDRVRDSAPDLCVIDYDMPRIDGMRLCRSIKADPATYLLPVIMLTGVSPEREKLNALEAGVDDFLAKPVAPAELLAKIKSLLRIKSLTDELEDAEVVLFTLARTIEVKDPYTMGHADRVARHGVLLGRALGFGPDKLELLRKGGILHDIGKLGVPDSILMKPGPLTEEERRIMSTHDRIGVEILRDAFSMQELGDIVGSSHAWFNGNPYEPNLPTGDAIPLGARILTIADAYDAMTSDRVYRKARPPQEAFDELRRCSGEQFDPYQVKRFIEIISKDPLHAAHRGVSKQMALAMGIQAERIAIALEARDFASLASMAGQLVATTRDECWESVTAIAAKLRDAAKNDPDMFTLVSLTTELMQICNSSQESCLDEVQHAAVPALSLVDASAPSPIERDPA